MAGAIGGVKAEEPQNTQVVFLDAFCRVADEPHAAMGKIVEAAGIIVDGAIARHGERVDREVAPFGIGFPVAAKFDLGMPAKCFDVLAQRRYLERMLVDHDGHRAVLDAGRNGLEARRGHALHDFVGHRRRGYIDLQDRHTQQRVADRPAHGARLLAVAIEYGQQPRQRAGRQPGGTAEFAVGAASLRSHYFVVPGTNLPSSIWAGT